MFKYLFLFICLTSFCITGFSQKNNVIKGKLVDSLTAEPLSFASVQLESKNQIPSMSVIANEQSFFEFQNLKIGDYT
jgi:hypothetical protein